MRVAIIDYGSGNLRSATKAFERAAPRSRHRRHDRFDRQGRCGRLRRPHCAAGCWRLCRLPPRIGCGGVEGMTDALIEAVEQKARPFLGICVGMQLMSSRGLEKTVTEGLGWIKGDVVEMTPDDPSLKIRRSAGIRSISSGRTRSSRVSRRAWTDCTPISYTPITLPPKILTMSLPPQITVGQ